MGKRKSEDELEEETEVEEDEDDDDDDLEECCGDEDEDGESESSEEHGEEDEDDESDEDDEDDEEGTGSEDDDDESNTEFEEGNNGSDIDDVIQDDEFEGVSDRDVSDGEAAANGEEAEEAKEMGKEGGRKEGLGLGSAFGRAFTNIMKMKVPKSELTDSLGPVLAERKQLLVKKLEEQENERKKKSDLKKKKREEREKGHSIPQSYTDAKEKAMIKLATTGVVRLFNAVSKAQKVQANADISSSRAAKATWKQSKQVFMSQLRGGTKDGNRPVGGSEKTEEDQEAGWAALKDDFMLGSSKMKDWDKNPDDLAV